MKKLLTFAAFVILFIIGTGMSAAAQITDIKGHWAEGIINESVEDGYVSGYKDGSFKPNAPITRAEFIVVMNRFAGIGANITPFTSFPDVSREDWFFGDIQAAAGLGFISGNSDGTFRPNTYITREAAAVAAAKYLRLPVNNDYAAYFSDCGGLSWSRGLIGAAVKANVISGYNDGTFRPFGTLTRAEALSLAKRAGLSGAGAAQQTNEIGGLGYYDNTYIPESRINYQSTSIAETTEPAEDGYYKIYNWNYGQAGGEPERFDGNVHYDPVSAGTVRNIFVTGDFLVSSFVNPDYGLTLIDVEIRGKLVIYGVRDVELINCYIDKIEYRTEASGSRAGNIKSDTDSVVNETYVYSGVTLSESTPSSRGFRNITLENSLRSGTVVSARGDFVIITVNSKQAKLVLSDGMTDELLISDKSSDSKIEIQKDAQVYLLSADADALIDGEGDIERASVNVSDVRFVIVPKNVSGASRPEYISSSYTVELVAVDADGDALAGAWIELSGYGYFYSGNDGAVLFYDVSPGSYSYAAEYNGETTGGTVEVSDRDIYREIIFLQII